MTRLSRWMFAALISLGSTLLLVSVSLGGTKAKQSTVDKQPRPESAAKKQAKKLLPVREMGGY
jgi:hypothetical protein